MPKYKGHIIFNSSLALPLTFLGLYHSTYPPAPVATASISFVLATFLLSPDLDLKQSTVTQNWRGISFIWEGYSKVFSHRGWSHSVFLSSLTRLSYIAFVVAIGGFIAHLGYGLVHSHDFGRSIAGTTNAFVLNGSVLKAQAHLYRPHLLAGFLSVMASALCHVFLDRFLSVILIAIGKRRS